MPHLDLSICIHSQITTNTFYLQVFSLPPWPHKRKERKCRIKTSISRHLLPAPPVSQKLENLNQAQQHWHFNQRPDCRRQSLLRSRSVTSYSYRNRQLEIITCCCESLRCRNSIVPPPQLTACKCPASKIPARVKSRRKYDDKINQERGGNAEHGGDFRNDIAGLGRKKDQDREQETDQ